MNMRPPGLENTESFDDLAPWQQAKIIAYTQIKQYEESLKIEAQLKILAAIGGAKLS